VQIPEKFIGYAPDADPTTPGVIYDCNQIIPTLKGYRSAYSPKATTLPALPAACQGVAVVFKLNNSSRLIAGTSAGLYEDGATAWTDVTRAVGGAYTAATDVRWSFAQFNNTTLACIKSDTLQASVSGAFADVAGAPKASIVCTVNEFVLLFDTSEAIYGDSPNRWWCAAQGNYIDWTPSLTTNCYTGTLFSSPGKIRAAKRFGDAVIVYKDRAMYQGYFAGSPLGWKFTEIPGETGALSNDAVVNIGTPEAPQHLFMGYNDFYLFNGARAVPLGINVLRETVYNALNRQFSGNVLTLHDHQGTQVFFFYPTSNSSKPDKCVVYNYKTQTWGRDDRSIEACMEYIAPGVNYDGLGALFATYNDFPALSYDVAFSYGSSPIVAIIDDAHNLKTMNGVPANSSLTTGDQGNDTQYSLLKRAKPRFITAPSSANMVNMYRHNLSDVMTIDQTTPMMNNRFDVLRSARWHRVRYDFVGDMEVTNITYDIESNGNE
jgi:hypothetical protein